MADTIIENLITRFGFDFDQKTLDKIDAGIETAVKGLKRFIVAVGAAAAGTFYFTKKIAEANDKLGKFAQTIGVDVEALQELGFAAELNGAAVGSMDSALASLSQTASEASRGIGGGVEAFGILGISVTDAAGRLKSADGLLFDVSDAIAKLGTQAEKLELAGKLGIGSDLLLTIQQGSDALRRQREEARELGFIIDQDAAKAAADFNDEMLRSTKSVMGVANAIGQGLMKQITPMLKGFVSWFKANKALIKQNVIAFLDKVGKAIQLGFNFTVRFVNVVVAITKAFGGLENTILAVGTAFLLMNAKAFILPLVLGAALLILALLIEDLTVFQKGGESAFGDLNNWLDELEGRTKGTRNNFWKNFFADPGGVLKQAWEDIKFIMSSSWFVIEETIFQIVFGIGRFMEKIWGDSIDFIKNKFKSLLNLVPKLDSKTQGALGGGFNEPSPVFGGESLLDRGQKENFSIAPVGGARSQTTKTTNNDNRKIDININGGDLNEVRRTVDDVLNNKFSAAKRNLTTRVAY